MMSRSVIQNDSSLGDTFWAQVRDILLTMQYNIMLQRFVKAAKEINSLPLIVDHQHHHHY